MTIDIIGNVDKNRLYCTASFTKLMTTYVCLSLLAEQHDLKSVLEDDHFLDRICHHPEARSFLAIFQNVIGSRFTLRDVCSFYNGLPYTFDLSAAELESADQGNPFKHHCLMEEGVFLESCRTLITPMDPNRCKFHYSELAIIFLGYFIEKAYGTSMKALYQKHVMEPFSLKNSLFSGIMPDNVSVQDLSDQYDYPSIAIGNHGYFCYSNGFFTTLNDQRQLLEGLLTTPVFGQMTDIRKARAASHTLMNGLTVEIRMVGDDILYGYEGLSYSGCNIWGYSTKYKKGYITTVDSEEAAYDIIYGRFGYRTFDPVPAHTQELYRRFRETCHYEMEDRPIPDEYVGQYQRVDINAKKLSLIFTVGQHFIVIRNPDEVRYEVVYDQGIYRTVPADHMHGIRVGFYRAKSGNRYLFFDGNLYKKFV